jgi:GTP-binding protein
LPFTLKSVEFVTSVYDLKQRPKKQLPEVAVAGRSNVGKSSLLNCLFQRRKLAHTSKTPGKTQSINYYLVNNQFYLVDLPGYGYAKAPKSMQQQWADLMADYLEENPNLKGAVQLIDSRHGITPIDQQMIAYIQDIDMPFAIAVTKIDNLSSTQINQLRPDIGRQLPGIHPDNIIPFSSKTRQGKDQLWNIIQQLLIF